MLHSLMRAVALVLAFCATTGLVADPAQAQSSYRIQPGDTLQLEVLEDQNLNRPLLVLPDGSVSVPLVGSLRAAGRSVDDLRATVSSSLAPNFATAPTVYLSVAQLAERRQGVTAAARTIAVYALGEFGTSGKVEVAPGTTLLQFLAESGGLTNFAATKRIQLRRTDRKSGQENVYLYNYAAVSAGARAPAIQLQDGDVIIVPQRRLFE